MFFSLGGGCIKRILTLSALGGLSEQYRGLTFEPDNFDAIAKRPRGSTSCNLQSVNQPSPPPLM